MDIEKIAQASFAALKGYVDREMAARDSIIGGLRAQIAAIPAGKDGVNGKDGAPGDHGQTPSIDLPALARAAAALIQAPKDGQDGRQGADGASVRAEDLEPMLGRLVAAAMAALPIPRDGRDGSSVPIEAVQALVDAAVTRAVAALPPAIHGKDGQPGAKGEQGSPGKDGDNGKDGRDGAKGDPGLPGKDGEHGRDGQTPTVDLHEVADIIKADHSMIALLKGERGEQGIRGERGEPGQDGQRGTDGSNGSNGTDGATVTPNQLREVVESRFAVWALDFERLATDRQRAAIDSIPLPRDGRDGDRGRDGFGMDDFEITGDSPDGGRTLRLQLSAGGRIRAVELRTAAIIDRGTYSPNTAYEAGDAFTYGGSLWVTQKNSPQGKPGESADFRLAVRRGRDGKEASQ